MEFRELDSVDDLKVVNQLDERVWGMEPTPLDQTLTVAKNGGLIIGAFESGQLIGFSYGFPGFKSGKVYLCSHKLGVLPEFRDRRVGYQLKQQQAKLAKAMGYRLIRWTYDPLESRNAYLNIHKLGTTCHEYIENCYGEMSGPLNADLPSDRFYVDWDLSDDGRTCSAVNEPLTREEIEKGLLLDWRSRATGVAEPVELQGEVVSRNMSQQSSGTSVDGHGWQPFRYVPIPRDFQVLKRDDFALAMQWRLATRFVFQRAFSSGWEVTGIGRCWSDDIQLYVLSRRVPIETAVWNGEVTR